MTRKHFIKLVIPKMKWFLDSKRELLRQWRRLKTTKEIIKRGRELYKVAMEKERQNTDGSLEEAYGIRKQIEILGWVLGE